jgi:hypothetical protein
MLARSQKVETQTAPSAMTDIQKRNLQEYIQLLRSDVRQQKAEIMGAMMAFDPRRTCPRISRKRKTTDAQSGQGQAFAPPPGRLDC